MVVYAAGISGKAGVHYPGISVYLRQATVVESRREGRTEVSRGHSRAIDRLEGLNMEYGTGDKNFDAVRRHRQAW
jgi:hypothetical protein